MTDIIGVHLTMTVYGEEGKMALLIEGFKTQAEIDAVLESMNRGGMVERKTQLSN